MKRKYHIIEPPSRSDVGNTRRSLSIALKISRSPSFDYESLRKCLHSRVFPVSAVNFFLTFFSSFGSWNGFPLFAPVSFSECAISRGFTWRLHHQLYVFIKSTTSKVIYHWKGYSRIVGSFLKKFQSMWKTHAKSHLTL